MTTVTLPRRIVRPIATAPARRSMLIGFLAALALGLLVLVGASVAVAVTTGPAVLRGVSVGGIDLSGLDRDAARERLIARLPALDAGHAVVAVAGAEHVVEYAELGRGYEMEAILDAALAVGRDSGLIGDGVARLRAMVHPTSLPVIVHAYDPEALDAAAHRIARAVSTFPVQAAVTRDGTDFTLHRSRDGRVLDADGVRAALAAAVATSSPADVRVSLTTTPRLPTVDTGMANAALAAAESMARDLALTIPATDGEETLTLAAERIAEVLTFGPEDASAYVARVDGAALASAVSELAAEIDRDPASARITVAAGGGLAGVVPGEDGREVQVDEAVSTLGEALRNRAGGASVASLALPVVVTEPALTTAEAADILPRMRLVSSWTTYYVPGDGNGFGNNISIGAWDLDGYNIAPGEWFSFWGGIGPVTTERGYRYGGAIINGRSVPNGALAGGICSTSTTLFNAAMRFGLEIGERENHYYYIDRYPTGLDATVAIVDSSVTDMTFRNDTDYPIVIRGFGSPGQVTFQLWSVPNDRRVVLGAPVISNQRAAIETTQVVTSMAPGSARRVEYPHHGFDATVTRVVYAADGSVIHENTWFSDYRAVNGITLVGPTPAAPPPDDDEEPPEDEA